MARRSRSEEFKRRGKVVDLEEVRAERERRKAGSKKPNDQQNTTATKKSKSEKTTFDKRKLKVSLIVMAVILVAIGGVSIQLVEELIAKNKLEEENVILREELRGVYDELKSIDDPEYMEELAREKLDMVMPGEIVFELPEDE